MKREFIFAVGLLALGCLLFINRNEGDNTADPGISTSEFHVSQTNDPSNIGLVSYLQNSDGTAKSTDSNVARGDNPGQPTHQPSQAALDLIESATAKLLASPPISAKAKLKVNLFDASATATGMYLQANQGSGMSRMELEFDVPGEKVKFVQLCDGRFNYLFQGSSEMSEGQLNFVDLHRVAKASASNAGFASQPTNWFADGSMPRVLLNLSQAFDWKDPVTVQLANAEMFRIDGNWKPGQLAECLEGQCDPSWLKPEIRWDHLPQHLPQSVHIYFAADGPVRLFPHRIDFLRNVSTTSEPKTILSIELFEVTKREKPFPKKLFTVNSTNPEAIDMIDETEEYVARVDQLKHNATVRNRSKSIHSENTSDRTAQDKIRVESRAGTRNR